LAHADIGKLCAEDYDVLWEDLRGKAAAIEETRW